MAWSKPIYVQSRLFLVPLIIISQMELGETGSAMAALWLKGHFHTLGMETGRHVMGVARVQYVTCHRSLTHNCMHSVRHAVESLSLHRIQHLQMSLNIIYPKYTVPPH